MNRLRPRRVVDYFGRFVNRMKAMVMTMIVMVRVRRSSGVRSRSFGGFVSWRCCGFGGICNGSGRQRDG
jgi:hypothetical protein